MRALIGLLGIVCAGACAGAGAGAGAAPNPCDADPAAVLRGAKAARTTAVVVVADGEADGGDAPADFDEALERARDRAREADGGASARFGAGVRFEVVRTLEGAAPSRLVLPAPTCAAPAYLVLLPSDDAPFMVPLRGVADARLGD